MTRQMLRTTLPFILMVLLTACGGGAGDGGDGAGLADQPSLDVDEPNVSPADPDPLDLPLRAIHAAGNWATNRDVVEDWNAGGRRELLVPADHVEYLRSLHVNWVGLSVALHYDDSLDSTVERVYSAVDVPTFTDDVLRQIIRELRAAGFGVYLTLAFEAEESARPVRRWQLGDSGHSDTGVPPNDPDVFGRIRPARASIPWAPKLTVSFVPVSAAIGPTISGGSCKPWCAACPTLTAASSPTTCTTPSSRVPISSGRGRTICGKTWIWTWWALAHGSPWCSRCR